jgi:hypothetical protein
MVTLAQKTLCMHPGGFSFRVAKWQKFAPNKMLIAFKLPNTLPMFNEKQQNFVSTNAS